MDINERLGKKTTQKLVWPRKKIPDDFHLLLRPKSNSAKERKTGIDANKNVEQKYYICLSEHLHKHKCPQAHLQIMTYIFLLHNWEKFTHYYLCPLDLVRWYVRIEQLQNGLTNASN